MNNTESTVDAQEVNKFAQYANTWWDKEGPLKTLHDINDTRLHFITQHIALAGKRVLDVGCGGGILCEAMAKAGGVVTGIDAECDAINVAKEHALGQQLVIDYSCTAIEDYESKNFDVITCMELLEHVQNPDVVLSHCVRLLKPGGYLFLSTISRTMKAYASAIIGVEYILGILPKQTHDYKKFIKPSELAAMTRAIGLHLADLKGLKYNPLSRQASLGGDVGVNYLIACIK